MADKVNRRKKEEGRRKKEEGRRKIPSPPPSLSLSPPLYSFTNYQLAKPCLDRSKKVRLSQTT
ncbi:MAG: hypothetical protein MUE44_09675 [Oscillatoriaceae cyanobacterium Prado104]|nr:hypothetical protein [Oscillatoriaceae cyanobacterium Prado104]